MKLTCETQIVGNIPLLLIYPNAARRCPLVFVLHGFGGRKEDGLDLAYRLANRGLFVVAFDAAHHGQRADGVLETFDDPQRCTYPVSSGLDRYVFMHKVVVDTGHDLAAVLSHFTADDRVDAARCGVTGVSMGAFATYYAAATNPHIAAAAPIIGMPAFAERWEDAVLEASTYAEWRDQLAQARAAIARDSEFMRSIDPSSKLAAFYPRPLFMLCGDQDTDQPKLYTVRQYRALLPIYADRPDLLRLKIYDGVGHEVSPAMMDDVTDWFVAHLAA